MFYLVDYVDPDGDMYRNIQVRVPQGVQVNDAVRAVRFVGEILAYVPRAFYGNNVPPPQMPVFQLGY
jgi:hypothetical protein